MEIKQSFLNSLQGLFQDQAEALVEVEGLTVWSLPIGSVCTAVARPDTIMLWLDDTGIVELATAGDPVDVVDDT